MSWSYSTINSRISDQWADANRTTGFADKYEIVDYINDCQRLIATKGGQDFLEELIDSETEAVTTGLSDYPSDTAVARIVGVKLDGYKAKLVPSDTVFNKSNYNLKAMDFSPFWKYSTSGTTKKVEFYPKGASAVFTFIKFPTALSFTNGDTGNSELGDEWIDTVVQYCFWRLRLKEGIQENIDRAFVLFKTTFEGMGGKV